MKLITLLLFPFLFTSVFADFKAKNADDFHGASEHCFEQLKVPERYHSLFRNFEYPDDPIVHRYLRCVWTDLELWDDKRGFNVEHIADVYRDQANSEVLVPVLSECNKNTQNYPPLKWLYQAFKCVLDSRVGNWFREHIAKQISN